MPTPTPPAAPNESAAFECPWCIEPTQDACGWIWGSHDAPDDWRCTRPAGHDGQHVACGGASNTSDPHEHDYARTNLLPDPRSFPTRSRYRGFTITRHWVTYSGPPRPDEWHWEHPEADGDNGWDGYEPTLDACHAAIDEWHEEHPLCAYCGEPYYAEEDEHEPFCSDKCERDHHDAARDDRVPIGKKPNPRGRPLACWRLR